jgi:ABC-2 type transport system permease protein
MNAVIALARKDLALLFRDRGGLLFTFGVPILFAIFFGTLFADDSGSGSLSMAVVDEDGSDRSRDLIDRLSSASELDIEVLARQPAVDAVRNGRLTAYLVIPEGFGEGLGGLLFGEAPVLELGVDPSRRAASSMLEGVLTRYAMATMFDSFQDPRALRPLVGEARAMAQQSDLGPAQQLVFATFYDSLDSFLVDLERERLTQGDGSGEGAGGGAGFAPVTIETSSVVVDRMAPAQAYDISFPQGIIWGLIACIASFATSLVNERTTGTLVRLRTAPISNRHILAGKALACFVTSTLVIGVVLGVGVALFGIRPDNWPLLILGIVCVSAGFVGMMLLFSTFGENERTVGNVSWVIMMVMAMIGGGMIPLVFMPDWMASVSHVSPVKWAVLAIEGGLWRGFTLTDMLLPCGILLGSGAVCFVLGVRTFRTS